VRDAAGIGVSERAWLLEQLLLKDTVSYGASTASNIEKTSDAHRAYKLEVVLSTWVNGLQLHFLALSVYGKPTSRLREKTSGGKGVGASGVLPAARTRPSHGCALVLHAATPHRQSSYRLGRSPSVLCCHRPRPLGCRR
jgi:hypothetical protein